MFQLFLYSDWHSYSGINSFLLTLFIEVFSLLEPYFLYFCLTVLCKFQVKFIGCLSLNYNLTALFHLSSNRAALELTEF